MFRPPALEPVDWAHISSYGLYALENATVAAANHLGIPWERNHWNKAEVAERLARDHGLPEVATLMRRLNAIRKTEVYGEPAAPREWSPEDVTNSIEQFIAQVDELVREEE